VSDDALREAYARIMRMRDASRRDGAVPVDALVALVERRGTDEQRLRTLDAVMRSADARVELELLRAAMASVPGAASERISSPTTRKWMGIAAAAVLVAGASLVLRSRPPHADTMRGADGGAISLVGPNDMRASAPRSFVWRAAVGANRYTFELLDGDGTLVHGATTRDTVLALPASVRAPSERAPRAARPSTTCRRASAERDRAAIRPDRSPDRAVRAARARLPRA
jgi:hypothetical protein